MDNGQQVQRQQDSMQDLSLKLGAIACWNDGGYGHVAFNLTNQSSGSNYNGIHGIGNFCVDWFNLTTAQGTITYIYLN